MAKGYRVWNKETWVQVSGRSLIISRLPHISELICALGAIIRMASRELEDVSKVAMDGNWEPSLHSGARNPQQNMEQNSRTVSFPNVSFPAFSSVEDPGL